MNSTDRWVLHRTGRPLAQTVLTLIVLCVLCGKTLSQDWQTLKPGVEYAQVTKEISGLNVNMNLLRLDLTKARLDVVHAFDKAIGVDTTSNIAKTHGAFAAINAGFFRLDKSEFLGDPVGTFQVDHRLLSESFANRVTLLIADLFDRETVTAFSHPEATMTVSAGGLVEDVTGINRERKPADLILYTPEFGPSTKTAPGGVEILLGRCRGGCQDVTVFRGVGNTAIPEGDYVLSIAPDAILRYDGLVRALLQASIATPSAYIDLRIRMSGVGGKLAFEGTNYIPDDVVSGAPQLVKDSRVDITWEQEKQTKSFVETRHPRTAVARLKDGKFLMITVDGRSESSGGIGLQDLAEYLLSLGAVDAMNLDGGGSTTMWIDGKGVVNHPSDKEGERKVSDALLVTLRKKN